MEDSEIENHPHTKEIESLIWSAIDRLNPKCVLKDMWFMDVTENRTDNPKERSALVSLEVSIWIEGYPKEN